MSSEVGEANNAPQPIRMREGVRIVHITAVGITLKNFMCEYLLGLQKEGFDVIVVCSEDEDARYAVGGTGVRFCPVPIKRGLAPLSDLVSLYRVWWLLRRLRPHLRGGGQRHGLLLG